MELLKRTTNCSGEQCLAGLGSRGPDMPGHHLVPNSRDLMHIPALCLLLILLLLFLLLLFLMMMEIVFLYFFQIHGKNSVITLEL